MRRALLIVGKAPLPGQTKTRLVPPLTTDEAADLYRGFLLDSVQMGIDLGWERVCVVHPRGHGAALAAFLPPVVDLQEQHGNGLSDALPHAFQSHLTVDFDRVVLIASDNPTLPSSIVQEACDALESSDMSIGPSADGGYYLIGLRAPHLDVFEQIEWSTPRVYAQTLTQAQRIRLKVHALQEWYDVDEPADLEHLLLKLRESPASVAPNTRAALEGRLSLQYSSCAAVSGTPAE